MLQRSLLVLRSSPRPLLTDADIITLPARLGGLGILSHAKMSPEARAASVESSTRFLSRILNLPSLPPVDEDIPLTSQRTRCAKVLEAQHATLLSSLSPHQQESLLENASLLGRLALTAIPSSSMFQLTNRQVSAALHHRTLCPSIDDFCSCGNKNEFGHAEICSWFEPRTTARHEQAKWAMVTALKAIPEITVTAEPRVPRKTEERTDFRVTSHDGVTEYDLTIVSIASQSARTSSRQARTRLSSSNPPLPLSDLNKASLQSILTKPYESKNAKYIPLLTVPFQPLVFSVGGMMEDKSLKAMEGWREAMGEGSWQFLMRRISMILTKARAEVWHFE
jgi:hypothetical protein